jgi:hypothetical protein
VDHEPGDRPRIGGWPYPASAAPPIRAVSEPSALTAVIVRCVGVTVVGLGAWSELARKAQQGMDIDVHEFAVLDDGRSVTLHQERGFSTSATHMTADHAERSVLTTVLPDHAEITGEDHVWEWFASLIRTHGVAMTPEQASPVPRTPVVTPRLAGVSWQVAATSA